MKVENDVQLADVIEVSVEDLHDELDDLQSKELIVVWVDNHDEVERCEPSIDNPLSVPVHEIAGLETPTENQLADIPDLLLPLLGVWGLRVPL